MVLPTHSLISFIPGKNNSAIVSIKKDTDEDSFDALVDFFDTNFNRNGKNMQWFIKSSEADELCKAVDEIMQEMDQDESDDELIQEALARRFKSQSSGKRIEDEHVEDSEDEDVISLCRRVRHMYTLINDLAKRIQALEQK